MDLERLISGAADLALFTEIRNYIYARIDLLTEQILSKNLTLALSIILTLLTVWVMVQGYLIATGRSQEGLKGFAFNLGKTYFIIMMALGVASTSTFALDTLTDTLSDGISQIMTDTDEFGSKCLTNATESFLGCKIDQNLTVTQGIMGFINTVDTVDDPIIEAQVDKAKWFAGVGSAGPAVVAGTMMIVYRIAMALFVGFGPLFILSLLFKKTAPLFQKWLYYGIATIFSATLLGIMTEIATDLVTKIATALFVSDRLLSIVGTGSISGIMEASTQQLGLGLVLSTLLIVVPPMAGMWFNGVMGQFNAYSPISDRWNAGGGHAVPPHVNGGSGISQVENRNLPTVGQSERGLQVNNNHHNLGFTNGGINSSTQHSDAVKPQSQMRQEQPTITATYTNQVSTGTKQGENTDKAKTNKREQA